MSAFTKSEFASLLDDLVAKSAAPEDDELARPNMPYGFVASPSLEDEFWANVPGDFVQSVYRDAGFAADDLARLAELAARVTAATPAEKSRPSPSIEPAVIAAELGLTGRTPPKDLDRLRREFAFANHPDRVEPGLRDRAMVRMQIANVMIDQAKRKRAGR